MTGQDNALLLIGSPRGMISSSASIGTYFMNRLTEQGYKSEILHIYPLIRSEEGKKRLIGAINSSDAVVLSAPLYIDSIPAPVIEAMEHIHKYRNSALPLRQQYLVAFVNSGFPEPAQSATALAIYRQFATESHFHWAGGLAFASGQAAIDSRPLDKLGFMARNVRKSLDIAARAVSEKKPVPEEAYRLSDKPIIPIPMFLLIGNLFWWRSRVRDKQVWDMIDSRPYQNKR